MNHSRNITALLLLTALAGAASAQGSMTRDQVEAELAAAMRNGEMVTPSGIRERDLRPDLYPPVPVSHTSRAQVQAELAAAMRNGDMVVAGDSGLRAKDLNPGLYPADPVGAGKTREEVQAELAMAIRDGDMMAPGEAGVTENQLNPQLYAKQRARDAASRLAQQGTPRTSAGTLHSSGPAGPIAY